MSNEKWALPNRVRLPVVVGDVVGGQDHGLVPGCTLHHDAHVVPVEPLLVGLVAERLHQRANALAGVWLLDVSVRDTRDASAPVVCVQQEHVELGAGASRVVAHLTR